MKIQKRDSAHTTFQTNRLNALRQQLELTAAHVGFLHSPNVGAAQVTGLHDTDLVGAEPVIQRTVELLGGCADSVQPCIRADSKPGGWRYSAYTFVLFLPLLCHLGRLNGPRREM